MKHFQQVIKWDFRNNLKKEIPHIFHKGNIDYTLLKKLLKDDIITDGSKRLNFSWIGKNEVFDQIKAPVSKTMQFQKIKSVNQNSTNNLVLIGDNLEILKLMAPFYKNKVKMIYIDPPYNTGKGFLYDDHFSVSTDDYLKQTEQVSKIKDDKSSSKLEIAGRFHSDWLQFLYPRLFLARDYLQKDGVIFVSIDDNEVENLFHLMREIFGEDNYLFTFVRKQNAGGKNDALHVSTSQDYILAFAKAKSTVKINIPNNFSTILTKYTNNSAHKGFKELFEGRKVFDYPKPIELLKYLIHLGSEKDSLIFDFFAGSGTLGQALWETNVSDGGSRQFLVVAYPEETKNPSIHIDFPTVADICVERLRRASQKYQLEQEKTESETRFDFGFRVYEFSSQNP